MSDTLFDLVGEYKELYDMLTDEDVDVETVEDTLEAVKGEIQVKVEGMLTILNRLEMEQAACEKHYKKWGDALKVRKNGIERLKTYLCNSLVQMDLTEIPAGDNRIVVKNNGGVEPLVIDGNVPDSYMKVTYETDKAKIRNDLKSGKTLDFAHLGERGKHIEVK